ncbi:MAG: cation:proton antiporter [Hyphomicrobiaceae bacterium]|nr:cation:proton antiporter [Hyphomicrobiaceae bacterium]
MTGEGFLELSIAISLAILSLAFLLTVVRILKGPTVADRVLGLDMLVSIGIGFIVVIAVKTGYYLYLDVAISLGLVGFLATVAFARFVLQNAMRGQTPDAEGKKEGRNV